MQHCKHCETALESRRCRHCNMTGQEIADQRRVERYQRQMTPDMAKYKPVKS